MGKIPGVDPLILHELQQLTQKQAVQRARENRVSPDKQGKEEGRQPPTRQQIQKALRKLGGAAQVLDSPLRFQLVERNGQMAVQMLDEGSGRLLREVAPERVLDLVGRLEKVLGLLLDELF